MAVGVVGELVSSPERPTQDVGAAMDPVAPEEEGGAGAVPPEGPQDPRCVLARAAVKGQGKPSLPAAAMVSKEWPARHATDRTSRRSGLALCRAPLNINRRRGRVGRYRNRCAGIVWELDRQSGAEKRSRAGPAHGHAANGVASTPSCHATSGTRVLRRRLSTGLTPSTGAQPPCAHGLADGRELAGQRRDEKLKRHRVGGCTVRRELLVGGRAAGYSLSVEPIDDERHPSLMGGGVRHSRERGRSDEAIAASDVSVKERQRPTWLHRLHPQRDLAQLHGHRVHIDAADALSDHVAQCAAQRLRRWRAVALRASRARVAPRLDAAASAP